jgi:hypothetical protein
MGAATPKKSLTATAVPPEKRKLLKTQVQIV